MLVTFLVSDWRDAAFSAHSEEGSGSYISDRKYTLELTEEEWICAIQELYIRYDEDHTIFLEEDCISIQGFSAWNCTLNFNSMKDVSYSDLVDEFEDYLDWASEL